MNRETGLKVWKPAAARKDWRNIVVDKASAMVERWRDTAPPPTAYRDRQKQLPGPEVPSRERPPLSARWRCFWLGVGLAAIVGIPVLGILLDFNWGVLTMLGLRFWLKAVD